PPELLKLSSAMAALNSVSSASGINLMTSVSLNPLRAALNALMANLDVLKLESVNAASISSVNQLNAVLPAVGVNFRPLASINFTGIKLSALPDLSSLSQVATLSWQLNNGAGINLLPSRPCGGACPVSGAALM
ncbi:MAG: hypothetical protein GY731_00585, partial [Gammaproteobacteria bacterium]|nr:hypothetical protein [Gammaproteobacteria bacterium]